LLNNRNFYTEIITGFNFNNLMYILTIIFLGTF